MTKRHTSHIILIITICMLTACQTTSGQQNFPIMTFKYLPAIKLMVSDIKLISNVKLSFDEPNVAYKLSVSPEKALIQWTKDRLVIGGDINTAKMIIIRADAHEIKLKLDRNLTGMFKNQQSHRFEIFIEARLEILDKNKVRQAFVTAKAQQSITVSEATSMSDRLTIWYNLVEKLMNEFNLIIQKNIEQKFQGYLL
jgi:hypothetical protein